MSDFTIDYHFCASLEQIRNHGYSILKKNNWVVLLTFLFSFCLYKTITKIVLNKEGKAPFKPPKFEVTFMRKNYRINNNFYLFCSNF